MIRNDRGDHFLLISQHDHALLSGRLAELIGNSRFDGPEPRAPVLTGVELHDAGWPLHDDNPTLNAAGHPLHVFEPAVSLATSVWRESATLAASADPYAGLLVSLHVLNLSGMVVQRGLLAEEPDARRQEFFLINQFQQNEIERQESLRRRLGLRVDRPLEMGLAEPGSDREEDRLRCNYAWLRLCDLLSLYGCIGALSKVSAVIYPRVGRVSMNIDLGQVTPDRIEVDPWPFGVGRIQLDVPARKVSKAPFSDLESFRAAYRSAETIPHRLTFTARR